VATICRAIMMLVIPSGAMNLSFSLGGSESALGLINPMMLWTSAFGLSDLGHIEGSLASLGMTR
jgi:hypothetical protein